MQSSRDSSIWKSLAVAFGDGLAFGVGMKLSQSAARRPETEPQPELAPVADRLGQIEQRIARIERTPAAPPPVPAAPFDRKVLEAVVNAVDERLKEHAGQVERRIAEMENKVALESKSLSEQDEAVVSAVEEVQAWCDTRIAAIRNDVDEELGALRERTRGLPADLGQMDGRFAEIRAELAARDSEILELRRQIAESSAASRDQLMAIGQACRDAAGRVMPTTVAEVEPPAPADEPECAPGAEIPAPAVAEIGKPSQSWRIPVVSSSLLITAGLVLIRFL